MSEKTLELNIAAELLSMVRSMPGCDGAFWIGMKQKQEARNGIDELIQNIPRGLHLALQFKSPWSSPTSGGTRFFTFNDLQHQNLVRLASLRPSAVHYVLPHYNTFSAMRADSPNLRNGTYTLRVADVMAVPLASNARGTHKVASAPPGVTVFSDPFSARLSSLAEVLELFREVNSATQDRHLLTHEEIRGWLRELISKESDNPWRIGQRLRGFSTLCIS